MAIVTSALSAMNPDSSPPLTDFTSDWNVTNWLGTPVHGRLREEAAGTTYRSTVMTLEDGTSRSYRHIGLVGLQDDPDGQQSVGDERNLQSIAFTPVLLLREILSNSADTVQMAVGSSTLRPCVRTVLRDISWVPRMGMMASTAIDICFNPDNHLIDHESMMARVDGKSLHAAREDISFGSYAPVHGWLLPQTETVKLAAQVILQLTSTTQAVNVGVTPSLAPASH